MGKRRLVSPSSHKMWMRRLPSPTSHHAPPSSQADAQSARYNIESLNHADRTDHLSEYHPLRRQFLPLTDASFCQRDTSMQNRQYDKEQDLSLHKQDLLYETRTSRLSRENQLYEKGSSALHYPLSETLSVHLPSKPHSVPFCYHTDYTTSHSIGCINPTSTSWKKMHNMKDKDRMNIISFEAMHYQLNMKSFEPLYHFYLL